MAEHAMAVNKTHHQHDEPQDDNAAHTTVLNCRQHAAVTDNSDQVSDRPIPTNPPAHKRGKKPSNDLEDKRNKPPEKQAKVNLDNTEAVAEKAKVAKARGHAQKKIKGSYDTGTSSRL